MYVCIGGYEGVGMLCKSSENLNRVMNLFIFQVTQCFFVFCYLIKFQLLYIDLQPGQTCHSKDAEVAYSIGVGGLG